MKKTLSIFILILLLVSCGITKRQHLSGWYFPPSHKLQTQVNKQNTQNPEVDRSNSFQEIKDTTMSIDFPETVTAAPLSIEKTLGLPSGKEEKRTHQLSFSSLQNNRSSFDNKILSEQSIYLIKEKSTIKRTPPKVLPISKGGKIFWLTILFIVLFGAFVVCGALWPEAYIIWFGITALIALFGASTGGDSGSFGERIGAFFLFILLGLFYVWIYLYFPVMWPAIFLQLIIYGGIGLIGLVVWAILKRRKK